MSLGKVSGGKVYLFELNYSPMQFTGYKHSTFMVIAWQADFRCTLAEFSTFPFLPPKLIAPMLLKFLLALAFATMSMAATAKPAPWFWWVSKVDGARICMQTSPGSGWFRLGEPYNNSRCSDAPLR